MGPTSRSDPTLGQCFYTTFGMHTVHFNNSGIFRSLPMHRRRCWRRPRRRWRRRWRRVRPPGGRGRGSSSAFVLRTAGRHRTRCQKRPAEGRLRADSAQARARARRLWRRAATRRAAAHHWRWRARPTRLQATIKRPARTGRTARGQSSEQQGGTRVRGGMVFSAFAYTRALMQSIPPGEVTGHTAHMSPH